MQVVIGENVAQKVLTATFRNVLNTYKIAIGSFKLFKANLVRYKQSFEQ